MFTQIQNLNVALGSQQPLLWSPVVTPQFLGLVRSQSVSLAVKISVQELGSHLTALSYRHDDCDNNEPKQDDRFAPPIAPAFHRRGYCS